MKTYKSIISLSKNERGIWDLDTIKGCKSGIEKNSNGCYSDCYAAKTAKRYGIDFSKSINRYFESEQHRLSIINQIEKIDMPFIRIGCSGDPSEDWQHTIDIIDKIKIDNQYHLFDILSKKQIVIITRHWNLLSDKQLKHLMNYNLCINTSISVMDNEQDYNNSLAQYERLKPFCKSVLRVVTCDFNEQKLLDKQNYLLAKNNVIDTVFRPNKNNQLVINGSIKTKKMGFMNSKALVSKFNKKTFLGKCSSCLEMCGLNL